MKGLGESNQRVKVLRYDPRARAARIFMLVLGVFVSVGAAYLAGSMYSGRECVARVAENAMLAGQLREAEGVVANLTQQVANMGKGTEIDHAAASSLRSEFAAARTQISRMQQEITIYKSLMDNSVKTRGLVLHRLEVRRAAEPLHYRYRLVFLQRAQKQILLRGSVEISVSGMRNGVPISLRAEELFVDGQEQPRLELLYFQTIEGNFSLPPGFEPGQIHIEANIGGARAQRLEQTLGWMVLED